MNLPLIRDGSFSRSVKYRDLSFIVILVFVVSGLQLLTRVNRAPEIPRDSLHSIAGGGAREQCLSCHQRNAQSAPVAFDQPHMRPKQWRAGKLDCLLCHRGAVR